MKIRIGARGSALSLAQTALVAGALAGRAEVDVIPISTTGDRLSRLEAEGTGKDLFTREIDEALREGRIDLGVHSAKDLPSRLASGLVLAAVPTREDPSDVLVSRDRVSLAELERGARVGTSSARRRAQVLAARPDLEVVAARGNVDTRIRRMNEGRWDAIVLARAGLARLGRLVRWLQPRVVCFVGLAGWRAVVNKHAVAGEQPDGFEGARCYVMPNPSGLNAHATVTSIADHLAAAAQLAATS